MPHSGVKKESEKKSIGISDARGLSFVMLENWAVQKRFTCINPVILSLGCTVIISQLFSARNFLRAKEFRRSLEELRLTEWNFTRGSCATDHSTPSI